MTTKKIENKKLIVAFVTLLVALNVLIIALPTPVIAQVTYDNSITAGKEGFNPLGWKLTGVYSKVVYAYDWSSRTFLEFPYTYTEHWAEKAWWCFTCYAEIRYTYTTMGSSYIRTYASWKMGSWNGGEQGFNEIECKTTSTSGYVWHRVRVYSEGNLDFIQIVIEIVPIILSFIK